MPAPHPPEFRRRAVPQTRIGNTEVFRDLGDRFLAQTRWMAQADADEGKNTESGRLSTDERTELNELRKKNKRLEVELEIVKRAEAYFAKENVLRK